ncbi:MAG TPA: hypothetical protein VGJ92_00655 [Methanocella sp.]|jgi:hypothetical protein
MAAAPIVLTEVPMALADKYLYDGERILAVLPADGFLQERELAATDGRIICAKPATFYDVGYGTLSSVSCGSIYQPAWAGASFVFTALAIAFARAAAIVPENLSFGPFNVGLGWLASLVGFPGVLSGAIAIGAAVVFLLTARMGISLRTPGGTFVFSYGRGRQEQAVAFTKTVRAACHRKS